MVFVNFSYQDFTIWFFGREVTGVVDELWYEFLGEEAGVQEYDYFVNYTFTDKAGQKLQGTTELSLLEWSVFREGMEVTVVYSPFNPAINRLDDSRFVPLLFCSYLPVAIIIWLTLMFGWRLFVGEVKKPEPIPRLDDFKISRPTEQP